MQIQQALPRDLEQLLALPPDPAPATGGPERLRAELAAGRMRRPGTWLVLDDDASLGGRAPWWGREDSTAALAPECLHLLDGSWTAVVDASRGGCRPQPPPGSGSSWSGCASQWTSTDGLSTSSGRWHVRPGGDEEFLALFVETAVGSLHVTTRRALDVVKPADQARDDLDSSRSCPGEGDRWRVATTPDGGPVGVVVPSATPCARTVGRVAC